MCHSRHVTLLDVIDPDISFSRVLSVHVGTFLIDELHFDYA